MGRREDKDEEGREGEQNKEDVSDAKSQTGKMNLSRYEFSAEEETRLVDFFEQHGEF